jgi:hypothetical protein
MEYNAEINDTPVKKDMKIHCILALKNPNNQNMYKPLEKKYIYKTTSSTIKKRSVFIETDYATRDSRVHNPKYIKYGSHHHKCYTCKNTDQVLENRANNKRFIINEEMNCYFNY